MDFDNAESHTEEIDGGDSKGIDIKKKMFAFAIVILIAVVLSVVMYKVVSNRKKTDLSYKILKGDLENGGYDVVMYDLPKIKALLKPSEGDSFRLALHVQIALEFKDSSQVQQFEVVLPRLLDAIMFAASSLEKSEVDDAKGIYFLKEEILYRINLILSPIEVGNVYFKSFDFEEVEIVAPEDGVGSNG